MLAGPTSGTDYFDSIARGFPTPNESSLRTGLTPGGGGSMFPAPSPNSQAILQQLQSGGATPSTLEFHRTALNAAKKSGLNAPTSNPTPEAAPLNQITTMDAKTGQPAVVDPFTHHDAADAANGLFMLAKGGQAGNQFSVPSQSSIPPQTIQNQGPEDSQDTNHAKRDSRALNGSISSGREMSVSGSDSQGEQTKPAKGKGKKNTSAKATSSSARRKAEDSPAKSANKKQKGNNGSATGGSNEPESDDDAQPQTDTKKMTDEEKRRNFLERNRYVSSLSSSSLAKIFFFPTRVNRRY